MESGIKHGHLGHAWQHFAHGIDASQVTGGVQRCQRSEGFNLLNHLVGDNDTLVESLTTVSHTVTNGANLLEVLDNTHFGIDKGVEDNLDTGGMVGDRHLLIVLLAIPLVGELTHLQTDALKQALGHHLGVVFHVDQLILNRRTSTVQN